MSFVMQYLILRAILLETHKDIQTPSAFALPYSELRVIKILWRFSITKPLIETKQWTTCCILHNMGLVEMRHGPRWLIAVTPSGAMFIHELKMQAVKAVCMILLTASSCVLGFLLGVSV